MQFIDKAMNRVLKWENTDVTIPEMLDLIQTEILEKASDEELAQLKKGMQKTFVLLAGRGGEQRYYPSFYTSVRLCLEFHSLTHQLHSISLQDTVNKKEYFIPTGKASCTKLQSGVLRRMAQCGHGRKGAEQKPRYNDRYPDHPPERQNKPTYCRYCGEKLEHGASFCEKCGKPLYRDTPRNEPANKQSHSQPIREENTRKDYGQKENLPYENKRRAPSSHGRGGKFAQKRRSPVAPILITVGCLVACIAVGIVLWGVFSTDNVSLVQNGYLGEYTDMTVRELFDTYYGTWGYNEGVWGEGTSNAGEDLVELRYPEQDELRSEVVIRFKMLDKECFCVYVFKDPVQEVTKATDLYRHLNWMYCMAYSSMHPEVQTDSMKELGLMLRLESISGSAVEYGASADYKGDRAQICEKADKQPLEVNVALLLDNYGLIDLSKYYGGANTNTDTDVSPAGQMGEDSIPQTTATVPETVPQSNNLPEMEMPRPYANLLDIYLYAMEQGYDVEQMRESNLCELCAFIEPENLGYILTDINDDGIIELFIGEMGEYSGDMGRFYALYTLFNGEVFCVASGTTRTTYTLCGNWKIAEDWANSGTMSGTTYYAFNTGALDCLECIETVYYNGWEITEDWPDGVAPLFYTEDDSRTVMEFINKELITQEDANRIEASYGYQPIPFTPAF